MVGRAWLRVGDCVVRGKMGGWLMMFRRLSCYDHHKLMQ